MLLKQAISKNSVVSFILFWPGDEFIHKPVSQPFAWGLVILTLFSSEVPPRWKDRRTYIKNWLQRYTNGLHLEADAAPSTTLERRDMLRKIFPKHENKSQTQAVALSIWKHETFNFSLYKYTKEQSPNATTLAFDHSLLLFWSTSLEWCIIFTQKKKNSEKINMKWLKIAECFEKVL